MTSSSRNFLVLSDIHLGHTGTPTEHITKNLAKFLGFQEKTLKFPELKIVFISGDLWDKSVQLGADFIPEFLVFWHKFCQWAVRHKLRVRLLKGTPRHDGNQGATIESITKAAFPSLNFKYYPELDIDREEDLGLTILYVPDECRGSAAAVYRDVSLLLDEWQLQQVDISIMHGMFKFQLGTIPLNHKVHDEQDYLQLTKGPIAIGHIHKASQFERIYAPGSFDRLCHGEEEPKGAIFFTESEPGHWVPLFIENQGAKIFKSFEPKDSIPETLKMLEQTLPYLPRSSCVRIVAPQSHPVISSMDEITKRYPELKITLTVKQFKKSATEIQIAAEHHALILSKNTLDEAILNEIKLTSPLNTEEEEKLKRLFQKLHR